MNLKIYAYRQKSSAPRARAEWLRRFALVGVFVTALLFAPAPSRAQASARLACGITQITDTTGIGTGGGWSPAPSFNADGTRIAFASYANLTGGNPDGNFEIFLYDAATNGFTQITDTPADYGIGNGHPSISADGTRIAFASTGDLTGGNPDNNPEVFLYDPATNGFTQITDTTDPTVDLSLSLVISADGTRIAFSYILDVTGGNPDRNSELFLYDVPTGVLTQITNTTNEYGYSLSPATNANGTRIAFSSNLDLTGDNPDLNPEIFVYDATMNGFTQITHTTVVRNQTPSINADGTRIAFVTFKSAITLGSVSELFLYDATSSSVAQLTFAPGEGGSTLQPSINADGTRIAFMSDAKLTDGSYSQPARHYQVYLYDVPTNSLKQITYNHSYFPAISGDGTRIAFMSAADHTGGNPDLDVELFLANCLPSRAETPPRDGVRVYPLNAYTDRLSNSAYEGWYSYKSPYDENTNWLFFDAYGKINQRYELGLETTVTGNVTVRDLGDGLQQATIDLRISEGLCWGYANDAYAFGSHPFEVYFGAPAALGRGTLRITQRPQPVGPVRRWVIQSAIGNLNCEGRLRAGSGYPEGTPGLAQTTQTGLYNTGVPGGCPQEHNADCFPTEKIQFKPRGN